MALDPEQQAAQIRQVEEEARRLAVQLVDEPEQQREWIRQNNVIYGGLIAIGLVLVQPFLTATPLDWSAKICVIAFSVAIPLLAALVLVNRQENFRRRATDSLVVRMTRSIAQLLAFAGVVAGFWHILWLAGVGILVSGLAAMMVHSAGFFRLELAARATAASAEPAGSQSQDDAEELGHRGIGRNPLTVSLDRRPHRLVDPQAAHTITAAGPLPDDLRHVLDRIGTGALNEPSRADRATPCAYLGSRDDRDDRLRRLRRYGPRGLPRLAVPCRTRCYSPSLIRRPTFSKVSGLNRL